jgi:hypothetical protein
MWQSRSKRLTTTSTHTEEPVPDRETVFDEHPEARHVLDVANKWAGVAEGTVAIGGDETLKFTAVWIAFNALYNLASTAKRDFERVRRFAGRGDVGLRHQHLLESDSNYHTAVKTLARRPVFNHWIGIEVEIRDLTDVKQVLDACYAIRGNLVHGHKSPDVPRDLELVGAAYLVVLPLVTHFVDPVNFFPAIGS